jgi:hypothetical protein
MIEGRETGREGEREGGRGRGVWDLDELLAIGNAGALLDLELRHEPGLESLLVRHLPRTSRTSGHPPATHSSPHLAPLHLHTRAAHARQCLPPDTRAAGSHAAPTLNSSHPLPRQHCNTTRLYLACIWHASSINLARTSELSGILLRTESFRRPKLVF